MSTIAKEKIDTHSVIVDTNILFDQDKSKVVSPQFDEFWEKHSAEANLELKLPEVVIGEILFQQTTAALKTLSRANKSFGQLASFTGKKYSHRVSEKRVEREIKSRFYIWAKSKKFEELPAPVDDIKWESLIDDSIWRRPPFSYDPDKMDQEKGFRDALILETVVSYCEFEFELGKKFVFITNDKLLRKSSEKRLKREVTFSAFESLDGFAAYLRLEKESFEGPFIKAVVNKAAKKFFKFQDENSLVYKVGLPGMVRERYSEDFNNPQSLIPDDFENGFYSGGRWKPVSTGTFSFDRKPQFQNIEGECTFLWLSKVHFDQVFECEADWHDHTHTFTRTFARTFTHEIIFDVHWKANISIDERFTKIELIDVELADSKLSPTSY